MATVTVNLGDKEVKEAITEWVAKHLNMKVKGPIEVITRSGGGDNREYYGPTYSASAPAEQIKPPKEGYYDQ